MSSILEFDIPFDDLDDCIYDEVCSHLENEYTRASKYRFFSFRSIFTFIFTIFCSMFLVVYCNVTFELSLLLLLFWFIYNITNFYNYILTYKEYIEFNSMKKEDYINYALSKFNLCDDAFNSNDFNVNVGRILSCWYSLIKVTNQEVIEYCLLSNRFLLIKSKDKSDNINYSSFIVTTKATENDYLVPKLLYDLDSGDLVLYYNKSIELVKAEIL